MQLFTNQYDIIENIFKPSTASCAEKVPVWILLKFLMFWTNQYSETQISRKFSCNPNTSNDI
jgi:hypothetical protein